MRFQYLRPVNTIFLLFFEMQKYKKILICSQNKLNINTILTQLVIENKFKHKYSISYTQNHHQKSINKKGTEPQNTYESYRLLCLIIIPNKMYEEILFDIHTTDMKTRTTTGCITTA